MIRFNYYFSSIPVLGKKTSYNTVDSWFRIKKNAALGWNKLLIVIMWHNPLVIFRSKWINLKYTLNLVRCFLLHSTTFQYFFFYGFKSQLSNSYGNWYVQKYLKGIFHKGMLLIWKEYFTCAILSFSSPRCAIIARLNVIYTKFRRAMIVQLNKMYRVGACARAIARLSRPGLICVIYCKPSFFLA